MKRSQDMLEYIAKLSRMIRRRPIEEQNLPHIAYRLLGIIVKSEGVRTTQLADKLGIRPSSLTDILKRLEETGYIRREKDFADSRVTCIYATDKTHEEHERQKAKRQAQNAYLRSYLTEEEANMFCQICEKLCDILEQDVNLYDNRSNVAGVNPPCKEGE